MSDFNSLYQRYRMGRAYQRITTQMGPSPQLVAFVNYDRVTPDSLGLESFNIMDQHEQIVEHIGTDTSMHLAIEGLLSKLFGEKIPLRSEFVSFQNFHTHTINYLNAVLNKVPAKADLKAWEAFEKKVEDSQETYFKNLSEVNNHIVGKGAKDIESSGWNQANYNTAVAWTKNAQKQSKDTVTSHQAKLAAARASLADAGEDKAKIEAIINRTIHLMHGMDTTGAGSADQAEALLKKIAPKLANQK